MTRRVDQITLGIIIVLEKNNNWKYIWFRDVIASSYSFIVQSLVKGSTEAMQKQPC